MEVNDSLNKEVVCLGLDKRLIDFKGTLISSVNLKKIIQ